MILIQDVPLVSLQQALFALIKKDQDTPIYGSIPTKTAKLPYITIGSVTAKPMEVKTNVFFDLTINIDVWAATDDRQKTNEILNDLSTIISYKGDDLCITNYEVINTAIEMVEAFPAADGGYHGTLTARFTLQRV